jgi:hypothetical protein
MVCADVVNWVKTEALFEASNKHGKFKYMIASRHQNIRQSHSLLTDNKPFENIETTETNQNFVHEEIKSR